LFRYCLALTSNPFDSEGLVCDTIIKTINSDATHRQLSMGLDVADDSENLAVRTGIVEVTSGERR